MSLYLFYEDLIIPKVDLIIMLAEKTSFVYYRSKIKINLKRRFIFYDLNQALEPKEYWMNKKAMEMTENLVRFFQLKQQSLILAANGKYKRTSN